MRKKEQVKQSGRLFRPVEWNIMCGQRAVMETMSGGGVLIHPLKKMSSVRHDCNPPGLSKSLQLNKKTHKTRKERSFHFISPPCTTSN